MVLSVTPRQLGVLRSLPFFAPSSSIVTILLNDHQVCDPRDSKSWQRPGLAFSGILTPKCVYGVVIDLLR